MRRVSYCSFCAILFFALFLSLHARAAAPSAPFRATIGNSVVALTGPWRFHPGDNMAWAQPHYNDSGWATMDLTPPAGSIDPTIGTSGFVPGWTARGYPKLTGYAWYRLRVDVESSSGGALPPLAIRMPDDVDDAYQVYVNGQFLGEFGHFSKNGVTFINSQPRAFALPAHLGSGPVTIAIRMWMSTATPFMSFYAGGLHGPPLLGQAQSIDTMLKMDWDGIDRSTATYVVRIVSVGVVALLGFLLFWLERREKAYLWLALACTAYLLELVLIVIGYYATWLPMVTEMIAADVLLTPLLFGLWAIFWGSWFGLPEMRRIHRVVWSLVVLLIIGVALLRAPLYGRVIPVSASTWLMPLTEIFKLAFGAVILWIAYRGIRTRGVEGWLALVPILLMPVWLYQDEMVMLHFYWVFVIYGIPIAVGIIAIVLMLVAVSLLMLRRFVGGLREKQQLETEMEQARQVQHVLIPEAMPAIPGFEIHSEYRPAREVGGDFFQIVPLERGAFLAVIGDVSGKGMPAAMTVGLLVGTLRTLVESSEEPARILAGLNRRLYGRVRDGFTTCLVARVDGDGRVTAANAGHLAPYLNGREMAVANGLPLGLSTSASYGETSFQLAPGARLTLISDGVVEARSKTGELFGFERAAAIASQPAMVIARAAEQFGQEDDITVLGVVRLAAEPIAAAEPSVLSPARA